MMTTPTAHRLAVPTRWALGLLLATAGVLVVLTGLPGGHALWAQAQAVNAGTVATGQVSIGADGAPGFAVGGVALDPSTESVCVGDTVRVSLPLQVRATGTTMAPVLSRAPLVDVPEHVSVTDNLAAVNAALAAGPEVQRPVLEVDVSADQGGQVTLGTTVMLAARSGSAWTATHSPALPALDFVECGGTLVTTWDTTLASAGQPHASLTFGAGTGEAGTWSSSGRIDWGDGTTPVAIGDRSLAHDYAAPGTYTVTVTGEFGSIAFDGSDALVSVDRWDEATGTQSIANAFAGADNVRSVVNPPSTVTTMSGAFRDTTANPDLTGWDTSGVTDMSQMFYDAVAFDGDVSGWDTSSLTRAAFMFHRATSFDGDVSGWDTSKVTNMSRMFSGATSFDGDVSRWDTSKVTNMSEMFSGATSFDGDVSRWDTSQVTDMSGTFSVLPAFDGDVSRWDTSKVTNMSYMFNASPVFDGDLSDWDTSKVTNMSYMFAAAHAFDGDVSGWDTGEVTNMSYMFSGAHAFDGDVSRWDTSKVTNMSYMFSNSRAFTGDLRTWNVLNITREPTSFRTGANPAMQSPIWGTAGGALFGDAVDGVESGGVQLEMVEPEATSAPTDPAGVGGLGVQECVVDLLHGSGSGCADVA